MANDSDLSAIAKAFTAHWRMFGLYPGAELNDEDGVLWYRSVLRQIPYNAVVRTQIEPHADAGAIVARICGHFRDLDLPFMWVVLPTDQPEGYETLLAGAGLDKVEEATGMTLDLTSWQPSGRASEAVVVPAEGEPELSDYERMIRTYWSVPEESRPHISTLNRHWTGARSPGQRFVAYLDGKAVGKLFVNLSTLPDVSVYGVAVVPEARNRGIARALMEAALQLARDRGATRMVLHSSMMGKPLYERMGFAAHCTLPVYATAPVFGTHHH